MEPYLINNAYSLNEQIKYNSQLCETKTLQLLLENSIATLLRLSKLQTKAQCINKALHVESTVDDIVNQIEFDYDSSTDTLLLKNRKGDVISSFDATAFVKDGMLQSVTLVGNELVFVWNTDSNSTEIRIDLKTLMPELEAVKDKNYIHVQDVASTDWNIIHNLEKYPSVTVFDSAGSVVICAIEYVDVNNMILHFSAPFSGKATLN